MVGVPPGHLCLFSAVFPEASVQLLPITPGMHPWVRYQECGGTLITQQPLAQATCELLTLHTQILPVPPDSLPTPTAAVRLSVSQSQGVCQHVCVWVSRGGEFTGSWNLINWSDMHTTSSCFVCHSLH